LRRLARSAKIASPCMEVSYEARVVRSRGMSSLCSQLCRSGRSRPRSEQSKSLGGFSAAVARSCCRHRGSGRGPRSISTGSLKCFPRSSAIGLRLPQQLIWHRSWRRTGGGNNIVAMTIWSWSKIYGVSITSVVSPAALPVIDRLANECIERWFDVFIHRGPTLALERHFLTVRDLATVEPWQELLSQNSPLIRRHNKRVAAIPVLMVSRVGTDAASGLQTKAPRSGRAVHCIFGLLARHEGMSVQRPPWFALTPVGRGELQVHQTASCRSMEDQMMRPRDVPTSPRNIWTAARC
jgi:hypothetical protein